MIWKAIIHAEGQKLLSKVTRRRSCIIRRHSIYKKLLHGGGRRPIYVLLPHCVCRLRRNIYVDVNGIDVYRGLGRINVSRCLSFYRRPLGLRQN